MLPTPEERYGDDAESQHDQRGNNGAHANREGLGLHQGSPIFLGCGLLGFGHCHDSARQGWVDVPVEGEHGWRRDGSADDFLLDLREADQRRLPLGLDESIEFFR